MRVPRLSAFRVAERTDRGGLLSWIRVCHVLASVLRLSLLLLDLGLVHEQVLKFSQNIFRLVLAFSRFGGDSFLFLVLLFLDLESLRHCMCIIWLLSVLLDRALL